jgi:hypothetical protein
LRLGRTGIDGFSIRSAITVDIRLVLMSMVPTREVNTVILLLE